MAVVHRGSLQCAQRGDLSERRLNKKMGKTTTFERREPEISEIYRFEKEHLNQTNLHFGLQNSYVPVKLNVIFPAKVYVSTGKMKNVPLKRDPFKRKASLPTFIF